MLVYYRKMSLYCDYFTFIDTITLVKNASPYIRLLLYLYICVVHIHFKSSFNFIILRNFFEG